MRRPAYRFRMGCQMTETNTKNKIERMKELVVLLNRAAMAYYAQDEELISNFEYDRLFDELAGLEEETGTVLAGSPTTRVGFEAVDELPKERHERPMLSLNKTKSREELQAFLGGRDGLLSWKMDGLTIVLTYEGGELVKAVTRGNGEIGEVVTANARVFENIPLRTAFAGRMIIRGEAVIRYSDFEKINEQLQLEAEKEGREQIIYKNPRNLCSGSVRQLNNAVTAARHVRFYAFALVEADGFDAQNSRENEFKFLRSQGFEVVEYERVNEESILPAISRFEERVKKTDLPSDGLVLLIDDIAYGESLGTTIRFPRNAMAFKWADEQAETVLREVEWSASRTGLINPVAIFDPVELEGTTVRRASVHNISIVRQLKLGIGDRLLVYKANMIIPQIAENLTCSDTLSIPGTCPVCGGETVIRKEIDSEVLFCKNPDCPAKKIKAFSLFVSRNAMNIDGLSEMTLEKLIGLGFIHHFADLYHLKDHRSQIADLEGFGERSCDNLEEALERSRETTLSAFLYALGIPGIGVSGARILARSFGGDLDRIREADEETLSGLDGIGPVLAGQIAVFFRDEKNILEIGLLLREVRFRKEAMPDTETAPLSGMTFVITGAVSHFDNRDALKDYIEKLGGKTAGSVSKNTTYLINNDTASASSKNRKAKELGIPIISEEAFLRLAKGADEEV